MFDTEMMRHFIRGFAEVHYGAVSLFIYIKFVRNILDILGKLGTKMSNYAESM